MNSATFSYPTAHHWKAPGDCEARRDPALALLLDGAIPLSGRTHEREAQMWLRFRQWNLEGRSLQEMVSGTFGLHARVFRKMNDLLVSMKRTISQASECFEGTRERFSSAPLSITVTLQKPGYKTIVFSNLEIVQNFQAT